ncbi:MAG: LemA family protein [Candidatus Micrarchaeota archaeon]|nr:LemA family protein [Candidatus Micrarchaeota archaeon]
MLIEIIIAVVVLAVVAYFISAYNRFVNLRNGIESGLKQINVALKKRVDLIGQVVDSVKGEMKFEKDTLTQVTKLRSAARPDMTSAEAKEVDNAARSIFSGLKVQVENYPNLKSNENVKQLIDSINSMEDEISRLRYTYNNTVQEFNTRCQSIPSNIVAKLGGFDKKSYLQFEETETELKKAPKISLNE